MIFHGLIYLLLFNPVLQYIFNESRACNNLRWAFGTSASMFWHIFLTLVDLPFDNFATPSPSILEFGLTIQAIKLLVTIALIALGRTLSFAEKTYSVVLDVHLSLGLQKPILSLNLSWISIFMSMLRSTRESSSDIWS